jgi:hypothetical protein
MAETRVGSWTYLAAYNIQPVVAEHTRMYLGDDRLPSVRAALEWAYGA